MDREKKFVTGDNGHGGESVGGWKMIWHGEEGPGKMGAGEWKQGNTGQTRSQERWLWCEILINLGHLSQQNSASKNIQSTRPRGQRQKRDLSKNSQVYK